MDTILRVAPTTEPISLDEAKEQLRLESGFVLDDTYISGLIAAARDRAEKFCNRFFTEQQVTLVESGPFPPRTIDLPYPDLQTVDAVKYVDTDQTEQTVTPGDYSFDSDTGQLTAVDGWPSGAETIKIDVTTGAPVEFKGVKIAMLLMISDTYETRSEHIVGTTVATNPAVMANIYPYRWNLGI